MPHDIIAEILNEITDRGGAFETTALHDHEADADSEYQQALEAGVKHFPADEQRRVARNTRDAHRAKWLADSNTDADALGRTLYQVGPVLRGLERQRQEPPSPEAALVQASGEPLSRGERLALILAEEAARQRIGRELLSELPAATLGRYRSALRDGGDPVRSAITVAEVERLHTDGWRGVAFDTQQPDSPEVSAVAELRALIGSTRQARIGPELRAALDAFVTARRTLKRLIQLKGLNRGPAELPEI